MAAQMLSLQLYTPILSQSDSPSLQLPVYRFRPQGFHCSWLGIDNFSLRCSSLRVTPLSSRHHPISATVTLSLPTGNSERVSSKDELPKWSSKAIKSFAMGELEARKLKYSTTGTEALLMGILIEGTNVAAKFLRANGITFLKVRDEASTLLAKADMYYFSPEHPPLTEDAQRALDWAVDEKLKSDENGEITTAHLLLGVWSQEESSPGHKIMASLGFTDEKAKELKSLISETKFIYD
ncbi:ATP-dependent Clp protease ATP-binding subunit CLPT2, chloroplastic [Impatiens glandulifera]|uniref:ATP-dependent Clp protease ATP-binding subunit CLPT2, chloroplastic n=1 Tax=Impatiens glandulifera TaxID=253017 RepID=UPI001FB0F006|nr:ATP-dependent Clp protease ATP-binding subunit CLPT2, chloroplastic [Impatiens glandulifera]